MVPAFMEFTPGVSGRLDINEIISQINGSSQNAKGDMK